MTKTVAFYSYKGGTGRSTGLCNVAYELASRGHSVGCIDYDIEAAGLHHVFDIGAKRYQRVDKLQDLMLHDDPRRADISDHVVDVGESEYFDREAFTGELYLVPAAVDRELTAKVVVQSQGQGHKSMQRVFDRVAAEYDLDYLFIDTRSGVSNSAIPSISGTDLVCAFFKFTRQHRKGTRYAVDFIRMVGQARNNEPDLQMVASNIPSSVDRDAINDYVAGIDGVGAYEVVSESEPLKQNEEVLVATRPSLGVVEEYRAVADRIE